METPKKGSTMKNLTAAEKTKLFSSSFSGGPTLNAQVKRKVNEIIANRNKPLPSHLHPGRSQKQGNNKQTKGGRRTRKQKRSSKKTRKHSK